VRGVGLGTAGLVVATMGASGLLAGLGIGSIVDRVGPRRTLVCALGILAVGYGIFPRVEQPWQAFVAALLVGVGSGGFWPAQLTLLGRLVPVERRHAAWGLQRSFMNLGLGLGGLTGGLIARTEEPATFTTLFLVNVASSVLYAAVLAGVKSPASAASTPSTRRAVGGYRRALTHRPFMALIVLNVALIAV
jgi:MFS family permease